MRRLVIVFTTVLLLLAFASPAAAAPPVRTSGVFAQASAFSSSCTEQGGTTLCTDVFVDVFSFEDEFTDVCVGIFSYSIGPSGRFRSVSDTFGCSPGGPLSVAADGSAASLASSDVQLVTCSRRACTEGDVVTVAADWTAIGTPFTYSGRTTFSDGTCTFRQSWKGVQSETTSSFSIDGADYEGGGFLVREDVTVTERCR
jgi:hypothetical protein